MANKNKKRDGVVYSSNPDYEYKTFGDSTNTSNSNTDVNKVRVWLEKNNRGGKKATVIKGYSGSDDEMLTLCKELKSKMGTGGSVKDGDIIIQGDFRDKVVAYFQKKGFDVKKAGS